MNNQNDISKGHSYSQKDISLKTINLVALFSKPFEQSLYASVQKLEKIVSAVYLVTDVMDESVPLTATLRVRSLEMLTDAFALLRAQPSHARSSLSKAVIGVEEVATLIHIGGIANHISRMNAEILETELGKVTTVLLDLLSQVADTQGSFGTSPVLPAQPVIPSDILRDASFDDAASRAQSRRNQNDIKTTLISQKDTKDIFAEHKTTIKKDIHKKENVLDRKQQIIQVLKAKQPATLVDIKSLVHDISDKTLQRELASLVAMGIAVKEGNKRWTVYKLT